ncbi:unnamed protein product [Sphagnum jensenii]|uniref:Rab-GAP TBC domain-containing protein n=1 Tax=Sphagnum jensenii TaxID=128206 RepID=A0ABP1BGD2_9BRYO
MAMYSGRATDAARLARFRKTLAASAIDIGDEPRTLPEVPFFQQVNVQSSLSCSLYIWAICHPASGYVQGVDDLVTPLLVVFLSEHLEGDLDSWVLTTLSPEITDQVG